MADQTPYIVVDNQKIAPLVRTSVTGATDPKRHAEQAPPFGVVDRVTISPEAREHCRRLMARGSQTAGKGRCEPLHLLSQNVHLDRNEKPG